MNRCVIVGGADIKNYEWIRSHLWQEDFYIFCDSGLRHLDSLCVKPNLIIGDFDSHADPHLPIETITLPCEKDDTDTVFAVKEAVKRGFSDFLLVGVVGERLDHTLGNLALLLMLNSLDKTAVIVDDYSEIQIVSNRATVDDAYAYFSLLNISGTAEDVNIENAKYPLKNATISSEYPLGISNEVLRDKTAEITIRKGSLLLIKIASGNKSAS